eukprot:jgi/Hompol1/5679/HPOL_004626-RA
MNADKLAKLQSQVRIGGKGTPRRKVKKVHKTTATDEKKLTATLNKLNVQQVQGIEEVNMFKNDNSIIHFALPKVQASLACNTFVVRGTAVTKDIGEMMPGILSQLGPESINELRKIAETIGAQNAAASAAQEDDDDVPDLVDTENFDETE